MPKLPGLILILITMITIVCSLSAAQQTQTAQTQKGEKQSQASQKIDPELEVQIWLSRKGFSPGELDATSGKNTEKALAAFQEANQLPVTPKADAKTLEALREKGVEPIIKYKVTESDVKGPFVEKIPEDFMEQSKLPALAYTSKVEALAEKFHVSAALLKRLNPNSSFDVGTEIQVPNVLEQKNESAKVQPVGGKKAPQTAGANITVVVSKDKQQLLVKDGDGKTIFYAPITAGSDEYPYPVGKWKVNGVSQNPPFEYNPKLFKDAPASHKPAKLPPGPNNPVGVVWIDLSAKHYGLHGTPEPGRIGYSESHGCIRLTNWDAQKVASLVRPGTAVIFE